MDLTNFSGSKCRAARRTSRKVKELEVEPECPALSFSFCFLSLRAWFKSPLGEPHSRCQATRLPGSRQGFDEQSQCNGGSPANTLYTGTDRWTNTCMCANTVWHVCSQGGQDTNTATGIVSGVFLFFLLQLQL